MRYSANYQNATENQDLISLINKVKEGNYKDNDKVYFNNISDDIANEIYELTGINVKGFKVAIEARQIKHILKDHGKDGAADESMANNSDIAKMEYAFSSPDDIRKSGKTFAYTYMSNGRNKLADTILYEKSIGEKSYYVVQAVADTKAKTLYVVSAFIGNEGYKKEASQLINANSLDVTSKNGSANASINSISQPDAKINHSDKKSFPSDEKLSSRSQSYSDYDKPITLEDIQFLREITKAHGGNRVSINDFTSEDIQKAQKWAHKMWKDFKENGVNPCISPFFRAWFGDWRAHEDNPDTDAIITKYGYGEHLPINVNSRIITNYDTGFDINIDESIVGDSLYYASINGDKKQISQVLGRVDEIVKNDILLDTQISDNKKKNKKHSTSFMHFLYAPITINNAPFLVKLVVEEYGIDTKRRGYNVQRIKMSTLQTSQFSKIVRKSRKIGSSAMDGISISNLYSLVKQFGKEYLLCRKQMTFILTMTESRSPRRRERKLFLFQAKK